MPYLIHFRKTITINIVDGEEYEKNKNFFVELGEPRVSNQDEEFYDIVSFSTLDAEQFCHYKT